MAAAAPAFNFMGAIHPELGAQGAAPAFVFNAAAEGPAMTRRQPKKNIRAKSSALKEWSKNMKTRRESRPRLLPSRARNIGHGHGRRVFSVRNWHAKEKAHRISLRARGIMPTSRAVAEKEAERAKRRAEEQVVATRRQQEFERQARIAQVQPAMEKMTTLKEIQTARGAATSAHIAAITKEIGTVQAAQEAGRQEVIDAEKTIADKVRAAKLTKDKRNTIQTALREEEEREGEAMNAGPPGAGAGAPFSPFGAVAAAALPAKFRMPAKAPTAAPAAAAAAAAAPAGAAAPAAAPAAAAAPKAAKGAPAAQAKIGALPTLRDMLAPTQAELVKDEAAVSAARAAATAIKERLAAGVSRLQELRALLAEANQQMAGINAEMARIDAEIARIKEYIGPVPV